MRYPKKAMVMGAGLGKRMLPLTRDIPKPLVIFNSKPLIDHVLDGLGDAGIQTAVVNTHYHADKMHSHLSHRMAPEIIISHEDDELLETGGGAKKALHHFENDPFVIHNSDSIWAEGTKSNIQDLISHWDSEKMDCLLMLALISRSIGYQGRGDFYIEPDGKLRRRAPEETLPFVFAGVSIIHPKLFQNSPDGAFSLNVLWDRAIENGRLYGVCHEGTWLHLGDPKALEDAEEFVRIS